MHSIDFETVHDSSQIFRQICEISVKALGLVVSVCLCLCVRVSVTFVRIGRTLAKIKSIKTYMCRFSHLQWKGVIAKIVLRDLDLLFRFQMFKIYEIRLFSYVAGS